MKKEMTAGVRICSSLEYMDRLLKVGNIKVLLISDEFPYEQRKQVFSGKRFVLTRTHCADLGLEETELLKYQSIDKIVECICLGIAEKSFSNMRMMKQQGLVIGVYSPVHRIGKTTFALKVGKELAEDENTLYLNLEDFAGIGGYFKNNNEQDLSNLLYYLKQEDDAVGVRIASLVQQIGNLDYIPPMKISSDLRAISTREWGELLEQIMKNSVYKIILLDIGDSIDSVFELLELCDWVFVPYAEDIYAESKMKQWKHILKVLKMRDLEMRCIYINMEKSIRQAVIDAVEALQEKEGIPRC